MKKLTTFCIVSLGAFLISACAGTSETSEDPNSSKPPSVCAAFGEAPAVTTLRTPVTAQAPHPDCVLLKERSALGQNQYCCMGPDFDAWYAGIQPSAEPDAGAQ